MHAVLEGRPVDRMPVWASYSQLYHQDHFDELTGLPRHHYLKWVHSPLPECLATYRRILEAAPFDIVQPPPMPSPREREHVEYVERDGKPYLHNRETDSWREIPLQTKAGHASEDYHALEEQRVFTEEDVQRLVEVVPAAQLIARGEAEGYRAFVREFGAEEFIMTGGVVGTIYMCGQYLGQTNLFMKLIDEPRLVDRLAQRITEQNIEHIRLLAAAGGDAIYIDDATATSEMISVAMYERFSMPSMKQMVDEIHRLGHKAVVIYFGGVMDRLEQIASLGADGFNMEASMKGYVNDIGEIARRIGDRVTPFANLNPYMHIETLPLEALQAEMRRQAQAARPARGLVMCSASPITMGTPLSRVRAFIDYARTLPPPRRQ
jgi:uroporphyrinogen-III decarboxylase